MDFYFVYRAMEEEIERLALDGHPVVSLLRYPEYPEGNKVKEFLSRECLISVWWIKGNGCNSVLMLKGVWMSAK